MRVHEIIKGVDRWWWHPKVNEAYLFMEIEKGNREVEQDARERVVSWKSSGEICFQINCVQDFWSIEMRTDTDNWN